jgi:hypothetical protein
MLDGSRQNSATWNTSTEERLALGRVPRGTFEWVAMISGILQPWYVTGFVEGEGSFTYSKAGSSLALYFSIRLPESDRAVLVQMQAFFNGVGKIYRQKGSKPVGSDNAKHASYYRVNRAQHLPVILNHFEAYPLKGEKALSFSIWREMVNLKLKRQRDGVSPELLELATRLSAASPRNRSSAPGLN